MREPMHPVTIRPRPTDPIGVFDSGVGGLTVLAALRASLPAEDFLYLGDTARVPYGSKSAGTIARYAHETTAFLLGKGVKAIVVACNTVSATCLDELVRRYAVPIVGVIEPACREAIAGGRGRSIGVIGTRATVDSRAYERHLSALDASVRVRAQACPLFVPLVEEALADHAATDLMAREYLHAFAQEPVDALVLACTHYPLLRRAIRAVVGEAAALVESGPPTARALAELLERQGLLTDRGGRGSLKVFLTDTQPHFSEIAERFLGEPIRDAGIVSL